MAVQAAASQERPGAGAEDALARRIALLRDALEEGRPLLVVEGGGADDRGPLLDALRRATCDGLHPVVVSGRAASRDELADRILEGLGVGKPRDEPSPSAVQRQAERLREEGRRLVAMVDEGDALDLDTLRWLIGLTRGARSCAQLVLAWEGNPRFTTALANAKPCPELPDVSFAPPGRVVRVRSASTGEAPPPTEAAAQPIEAAATAPEAPPAESPPGARAEVAALEATEPVASAPEASAAPRIAPPPPRTGPPAPRVRTRRDRATPRHPAPVELPLAPATYARPSRAPGRQRKLRAAAWLAGSLATVGALACLAVYAASLGWLVSLGGSQTPSRPTLHDANRDVAATPAREGPSEALRTGRSPRLREPKIPASGRPVDRPDLRHILEQLAASPSNETFDAAVSFLREHGPDAEGYAILDLLDRRKARTPQEAVEILSARTRVRSALCAAWADDARGEAAPRLGCPGSEAIGTRTAHR